MLPCHYVTPPAFRYIMLAMLLLDYISHAAIDFRCHYHRSPRCHGVVIYDTPLLPPLRAFADTTLSPDYFATLRLPFSLFSPCCVAAAAAMPSSCHAIILLDAIFFTLHLLFSPCRLRAIKQRHGAVYARLRDIADADMPL